MSESRSFEEEARSFARELSQVIDRHNELATFAPQYVAAQLLEGADNVRDKHGLSVDVVRPDDSDEIWIAEYHPRERTPYDSEVSAVLGAPRDEDGLIDASAHPEIEEVGPEP